MSIILIILNEINKILYSYFDYTHGISSGKKSDCLQSHFWKWLTADGFWSKKLIIWAPVGRSWGFGWSDIDVFFHRPTNFMSVGPSYKWVFSASKADFFSFNSRWIALRTTLDHRLANGRHILFLLSVGGHLGILIFLKCWTRDIVWRQKRKKKKKKRQRVDWSLEKILINRLLDDRPYTNCSKHIPSIGR